MKLVDLHQTISKDFLRKYKSKISLINFLKYYSLDLNFRVVVRYRVQSYLWKKKKFFRLISMLIKNGNIKKYGFEVGNSAEIGAGFCVQHLNGIVIGEGVKVGENMNIYQQVTFGQKNDLYPIIGDNFKCYPGAKIIGGITLGDNVTVGVNSVVLNSFASNTSLVGSPAKAINPKKLDY